MSEDPETSHHYESWAGRGPSSSSFEAPPIVVSSSYLSLALAHLHSLTIFGLGWPAKPLAQSYSASLCVSCSINIIVAQSVQGNSLQCTRSHAHAHWSLVRSMHACVNRALDYSSNSGSHSHKP